ncbi:MAG: PIN domain-containing protein [Reinekea sp.]
MRFGVFFDANVFYPAPLRDVLMQLATTGLFKAWWSHQVHQEWIRNLAKNRTDLPEQKLWQIAEHMNRAVPDCLVENYEPFIDILELPDPDDRHVLAAATKSHSQVIVTNNLKDFPTAYLTPESVTP